MEHHTPQIKSRRLRAELREGLAVEFELTTPAALRVAVAQADCSDHVWHSGKPALLFRRGRLLSATQQNAVEIVRMPAPDSEVCAALCAQLPQQPDVEADKLAAGEQYALFDALLDLCSQLDLRPVLSVTTAGAVSGFSRYTLRDVAPESRTGLLTEVVSADLPTAFDRKGVVSRIYVFRDVYGNTDNFALKIGTPAVTATPVRLHSSCLTGDLLASLRCDCGEQLQTAIAQFADNGGGVLLYLSQEGRGIGLYNKMIAYRYQQQGSNTIDANLLSGHKHDLRSFELAAEMLRKLGLIQVTLITNNPEKARALSACGITVVKTEASRSTGNPHNLRYLQTKRDQMGHRTVLSG